MFLLLLLWFFSSPISNKQELSSWEKDLSVYKVIVTLLDFNLFSVDSVVVPKLVDCESSSKGNNNTAEIVMLLLQRNFYTCMGSSNTDYLEGCSPLLYRCCKKFLSLIVTSCFLLKTISSFRLEIRAVYSSHRGYSEGLQSSKILKKTSTASRLVFFLKKSPLEVASTTIPAALSCQSKHLCCFQLPQGVRLHCSG